jgi:hypothetical protein
MYFLLTLKKKFFYQENIIKIIKLYFKKKNHENVLEKIFFFPKFTNKIYYSLHNF